MAWATVTRRLEAASGLLTREARRLKGLRRFVISRIGLTIAFTNLAGVFLLMAVMLTVTENRRGLVNAKVDSLSAQAEIIANVITETAVSGDAPGPRMDPAAAREVLRRLSSLYVPDETRALLHAPGPVRIADSDLIAGQVEQYELPPPGQQARGAPERAFDAVSLAREMFWSLFQSREEREALQRSLADEVEAAFATGEAQSNVRLGPDGNRVVSVTIPIRLIQAVVGAVTYESYDLQELIDAEREGVAPYFVAGIVINFFLTIVLTVYIAWPMQRLAEAARNVRTAGGRRVTMPDMSNRGDEIGELGKALSQMTEALYDRMDAIESFAADVAHEIKNPLTSIRSAAETLPQARNDAQRERLIQVIQHDVRRLDRLITDISNASRLDAELARENPGWVDMGRLLKDVAAMHEHRDRQDGVSIKVAATEPDLLVRGHEAPLSRVIINLVENALTFSPQGGTVRLGARRTPGPHGRIIVTVEDEGPGIPEDNLETIFERFYTQRPEGAAFGGHSGLGLAIARQIANAHGGFIRAENRSGTDGRSGGARFIVDLPAAASRPAHWRDQADV